MGSISFFALIRCGVSASQLSLSSNMGKEGEGGACNSAKSKPKESVPLQDANCIGWSIC